MKFRNTVLVFITFFILTFTAACAGRYSSTESTCPITSEGTEYYYHPDLKKLNFNRKTEALGCIFYLEEDVSGKNADSGIDSVKRAKDFCEIPSDVYVLKDGVTHVSTEGLWLNPEDDPALILAILLENSKSHELPFGVFAGVSAALLKDDAKFPVYREEKLEENLKKYPYVKELQYPLYTTVYTKREERETAWNFALKIGEIWLRDHTVSDLKQATGEDFSEFFTQLGAEIPDFYCPVGDLNYPWQVETGFFHYRIIAEFQDLYFTKKEFTVDYPTIKSYVEENERIVTENLALFGILDFGEKVDVFFGDFEELAKPGGMSFIKDNVILLRTVSATVHEMTHFVLNQSVGNRNLCEGICEWMNPSSYRRLAHYKMYKNTYPKKIFSEDVAKEFLPLARSLYNKTYGKANLDNFDLFHWVDCLAASMCVNRDWKIHNSIQHASFLRYLYETYGMEMILDLDDDLEIAGGEKTTGDLIEEWMSVLKTKFSL